MRKILLLLLPLLLVTLAVGACTTTPPAAEPPTKIIEEAPPEIFVTGELFDPAAFFDNICANCHGGDYTGGIGPSLIAHGLSVEEVEEILKEGRPGTVMPYWDGTITLEQMTELAVWMCNEEGEFY